MRGMGLDARATAKRRLGMITLTDKRDCVGCGACAAVCPAHCIGMEHDEIGFLYQVTDAAACINCRLCERTCPVIRQKGEGEPELGGDSRAIVLKCRDEGLLGQCGSGGAFTLLARAVVRRGGVVFGAAYRPDWTVEHIAVEREEDLPRISGTKYLQSEMCGCLEYARECLKSGREVLFAGTGCQVAGFKAAMRKPYGNLLTVNIACFGAPSPAVWKDYLARLGRRHGLGRVLGVNFRKKEEGTDMVMEVRGSGGTYSHYVYGDPYGWALCEGVANRPSCIKCLFKTAASGSDISVGDAHQAKEFDPAMEPRKGLSLAIAHTPAGIEALYALEADCSIFRPMPLPGIMQGNKGFAGFTYPHPELQDCFTRMWRRFGDSRRVLAGMQLRGKGTRRFLAWLFRDFAAEAKRRLARVFRRSAS